MAGEESLALATDSYGGTIFLLDMPYFASYFPISIFSRIDLRDAGAICLKN